MNDLSWFLYFADVVGNLQKTFVLCAFLTGVPAVILGVMWFSTCDGYEEKLNAAVQKLLKITAPIAIISMLVAPLIPSKETIYMIAGSQAGEFVVNTPEGKEILGDIKEVIKHQLEELKGKKENNE